MNSFELVYLVCYCFEFYNPQGEDYWYSSMSDRILLYYKNEKIISSMLIVDLPKYQESAWIMWPKIVNTFRRMEFVSLLFLALVENWCKSFYSFWSLKLWSSN